VLSNALSWTEGFTRLHTSKLLVAAWFSVSVPERHRKQEEMKMKRNCRKSAFGRLATASKKMDKMGAQQRRGFRELSRAKWTRTNSGTIIFHFFPTCGSRKSAQTPTCDSSVATGKNCDLRQPQVGQNKKNGSTTAGRGNFTLTMPTSFQQHVDHKPTCDTKFRRKSQFWPTCCYRKSGKMKKNRSDLRLPQVAQNLGQWRKNSTCGRRNSKTMKKNPEVLPKPFGARQLGAKDRS